MAPSTEKNNAFSEKLPTKPPLVTKFPTKAPAIPKRVVLINPPPCLPGIIHFAIIPDKKPAKIVDIIPIIMCFQNLSKLTVFFEKNLSPIVAE